jgi:hypothetical protein
VSPYPSLGKFCKIRAPRCKENAPGQLKYDPYHARNFDRDMKTRCELMFILIDQEEITAAVHDTSLTYSIIIS